MKHLLISAAFLVVPIYGTTVQHKEHLARHLTSMVSEDQRARKELIDARIKGDPEKLQQAINQLQSIDHHNTNQLKQLIQEDGWPTISDFGVQTCMHAWLLVQHADHDVAFQAACYQLMQHATAAGECDKKYCAYLYDRIQVNKGEKQKYGTQLDANYVPFSLENPEDVDSLRTSVGLAPLSDYINHVKKVYTK